MKVKAFIDFSNDGYCAIFCKDAVDSCHFAGYGDTEDEAKEDFKISVQEMYEVLIEQGKTPSFTPGDVEVEFYYYTEEDNEQPLS